MNRRCALCWTAALIFVITAGVAFYQGGLAGLDGLFLMGALLWALLAIQLHSAAPART